MKWIKWIGIYNRSFGLAGILARLAEPLARMTAFFFEHQMFKCTADPPMFMLGSTAAGNPRDLAGITEAIDGRRGEIPGEDEMDKDPSSALHD